MKPFILLMTVCGGWLALFGVLFEPEARLIWNRTRSAPLGLYWLKYEPLDPGRWVVLSASSPPATWAEAHGFTGRDWPLLKQVAGVPGDEICREELAITLNGKLVAIAQPADHLGRELPSWDGCVTLKHGELFLLNPHPSSIDGRYFGAVPAADILGVAEPVFIIRGGNSPAN
jgi:conjugative transfer signal peptidase TraF